MAKIHIVGTSHISPESLKKVEKTILEEKPTIVAIELDRKRLFALLSKEKQNISIKDIKRVGFKGWLFAYFGAWAEKKMGARVGVSPGAEMLRAVELAQRIDARVALIDQDIEITLRRFSRTFTWKEKGRFVADLFKGLVLQKGITVDLAKVPSDKVIQKLLADVEKRYPSVYQVLVRERNEYMAKKLANIIRQYPEDHIVAVVGAGHEKEIANLLKKYLNTKQAESSKKR